MKKTLSVILGTALILAAVLSLGACTPKEKVYNVGICQLIQHTALDAASQGFQDALKKILGEDKVVFDYQNASGEQTNCTTIINSFVSKKVDLIMANATPALQAAYNATSEIPVLGTSITEYSVALNLENFNGTVGGNVSGTSDLAPLDQQAELITELFPEAKTVGLVYCSAEPNSDYQVKKVTEYLEAKNITCTRFAFSDSNDIAAVVTSAAASSDVIYIPTDNTAAASTETIRNIIVPAGVPAITGEEGICAGCGVATLSISYYDLGYKTGEMAAKILKGEAKVSEMAIEYAPAVKKYNAELAAEYNVEIPEGFEAISE